MFGCTTPQREQEKGCKALLYSRHGGEDFQNWWKQSNKGTSTSKVTSDDRLLNSYLEETANWEMATYIKMEGRNNGTARQHLLSHLGGQTKLYCAKHHFPLIVSSFPSKKQCCCLQKGNNNLCKSKNIPFQCPVKGCTTMLCKKHSKILAGTTLASNNK